jgi:hypothetical protein
MDAKVRRASRVVVVLFPLLLFDIPNSAVGPVALRGSQAAATDALDRALRANDLQKARLLFPEDWAATEQLFVSYLERGYLSTTDLNTRALAARWAEVHFRIVEYDFARAVLAAVDAADATRRQPWVEVVRDYFSTLERLRVAFAPSMWSLGTPMVSSSSGGSEERAASERRSAERRLILTQFLDVADRFRTLGFVRGQFWTLSTSRTLDGWAGAREKLADSLANQLGDELSLVSRRPYTEASLAMAVRLDLPRRQLLVLEQ